MRQKNEAPAFEFGGKGAVTDETSDSYSFNLLSILIFDAGSGTAGSFGRLEMYGERW